MIPFEGLWKEWTRIISDVGAVVLTASGMFAQSVITSCEKMYKYKWIWVKSRPTNFINAKNKPMSKFEEVLVFSKGTTANKSNKRMNYFPQGLIESNIIEKSGKTKFGSTTGHRPCHKDVSHRTLVNYPTNVLEFPSQSKCLHPTQKPVALFEYLIRTYTNEGDTVLDNCAGSGTTGVACINTNRHYILIEKEQKYYDICKERICKAMSNGI